MRPGGGLPASQTVAVTFLVQAEEVRRVVLGLEGNQAIVIRAGDRLVLLSSEMDVEKLGRPGDGARRT